jgi:putative Mg2+ transporter-C (MgtC) family protein
LNNGKSIDLQQSSEKSGKAEIKGLTSAATIWLAAGLGAAAGYSLWQMSLLATVMALIVLSGVKKLKKSNLGGFRSRSEQPKTQPKDGASSHDIEQP